MNGPSGPSVPMSEPERELRIVEKVMEAFQNGEFDGMIIQLPSARDYLGTYNLDVDDEGFIIESETGEYATPYVFVDELVREYTKDEDESIFNAFFRPVTDEKVYGWNWDIPRMHLSDLHAIIPPDELSGEVGGPVRDGTLDMAKLYARLETGFGVVTGWSDLIKKEGIHEDSRCIRVGKRSEKTLNLNCLSAECSYSAPLSEWDGDEYSSPVCPECGGEWDSQGITVCTVCESWYWGTYFAGESIYAEPVCANCGVDMEYLEQVHRMDEVKDYSELVENEGYNYTVVGIDDEGNDVCTLNRVKTHEDAVEEKEIGTIQKGVEEVEIRERDEPVDVTRFVRDDDQT